MRLADFEYHLPDERIAQTPVEPRDSARLLVDQGTRAPLHRRVSNLGEFLEPGDILVVNDSKVIPARLRLQRTSGGTVEVLLLEPQDTNSRRWEAMVRPARKLRVGEKLWSLDGFEAVEVQGRSDVGDTMFVELLGDGDPLDILSHLGEMPLPPYITAPLHDPDRYQTVYAVKPGSAAAPTAGLHLTVSLLAEMQSMDIGLARVELVVGLDTFKPMSADDPTKHLIHSEHYRVPSETLERCRAARRVVAIGTTSVRALESAVTFDALEGRTRLFIHRGYEWKLVDLLVTNFHMPRTTLLLMIDAFVGNRWRALYEHALVEKYRFLSFGDAMLLDRKAD